jgi:hypothetical protein
VGAILIGKANGISVAIVAVGAMSCVVISDFFCPDIDDEKPSFR